MPRKSVLITGGAGFIGSHLCELYLAEGAAVHALDDLSSGTKDNIAHLLRHPRFRFTEGDVCDERLLDRLAAGSHTIVHLAAALGVQFIVEQPVRTLLTNTHGAEAVLNAARRHGCVTFLASTSEVYGKSPHVPFREDDDVVMGASSKSRWSYAASKLVDECLGFAYHREFGVPVVMARLFNTVGPRQSGAYGMVIPRMMRQAVENRPITVFGSGRQTRCFCDVRDVTRAIAALVRNPGARGQLFNIGGTREISILELAEMIRDLAGSDSEIVRVPYEQAYAPGFEDMERRIPDTAKIHRATGWSPEIGFEQTLADVRDSLAYRRAA